MGLACLSLLFYPENTSMSHLTWYTAILPPAVVSQFQPINSLLQPPLAHITRPTAFDMLTCIHCLMMLAVVTVTRWCDGGRLRVVPRLSPSTCQHWKCECLISVLPFSQAAVVELWASSIMYCRVITRHWLYDSTRNSSAVTYAWPTWPASLLTSLSPQAGLSSCCCNLWSHG